MTRQISLRATGELSGGRCKCASRKQSQVDLRNKWRSSGHNVKPIESLDARAARLWNWALKWALGAQLELVCSGAQILPSKWLTISTLARLVNLRVSSAGQVPAGWAPPARHLAARDRLPSAWLVSFSFNASQIKRLIGGISLAREQNFLHISFCRFLQYLVGKLQVAERKLTRNRMRSLIPLA